MSAKFQLDDKEVKKFLKDLENRALKINKEIAPFIAPFVFQDVMDHFKKEEGPKGKWREWSDSYGQFMNRIGKGGNSILQDTGNLRQGFKPQKYETSKNAITFYNDAKTKKGFAYAAFHDNNRTFMWLSKKAMDKIAKASLKWLVKE